MAKYNVLNIGERSFDFEVAYEAVDTIKKMKKKYKGLKVISVSITHNSDSHRWHGTLTYSYKKKRKK